MRAAIALVNANWISLRSYRLRLVLSLAALVATVVPLFFVANALQPVMGERIVSEGGQYFGFLVVGMLTFLMLPAAVDTLPSEIGRGISTGTLEALLGTRARLPMLLAGMIGFNLMWTAFRGLMMLLGAWALGAVVVWSRLGPAVLILTLIVLAYLPFGLVSGAMMIAFRTAGPLSRIVLMLSALLGGVYYPTKVIPSWIQAVSEFIPLTYGLRALRTTLLDGAPLTAVVGDIAVLCLFIAVLTTLGCACMVLALRHARRHGTLAQY